MTEITTDPCPVEAVFGPDDRIPCLLGRGHEGSHQYTPETCSQCGCLPDDPRCGSCDSPGCDCQGAREEAAPPAGEKEQ